MSRYSSAIWKPITNRSTKQVQKDICCWHTAVGSLYGTWNYFEGGAGGRGVYSHGMIGGIWGSDATRDLDGVAWQMQDSDLRSAANLDGNWRVIAWETADNAVRPIAPWTTRQCAKIVQIMVEAYHVDGIPLQLVPDSKVGRRGHAYHRLGCDPYRTADGELWSQAYGKDCPTDPRIRQLPALVERARDIVNGGTTSGGLHMDADVKAAFDAIPQRVAERLGPLGTDVKTIISRVGTLQAALTAGIADDAERDARVLGRLDSLSLPSFTAEQVAELAAALDLDEAKVADAVRRDLAEALSGPAA